MSRLWAHLVNVGGAHVRTRCPKSTLLTRRESEWEWNVSYITFHCSCNSCSVEDHPQYKLDTPSKGTFATMPDVPRLFSTGHKGKPSSKCSWSGAFISQYPMKLKWFSLVKITLHICSTLRLCCTGRHDKTFVQTPWAKCEPIDWSPLKRTMCRGVCCASHECLQLGTKETLRPKISFP